MIHVAYERLEMLSKELESDNIELKDLSKDIEKKLKTMLSLWESDTSHKFFEDFREKEKAMNDMIRLLDDITINMNAVCHTCRKLNSEK